MKQTFSKILTIITILILSGCSSKMVINELIDINAPFLVTETLTDSITGLNDFKTTQIEVNSDKWLKLVVFAKENEDGWTSTPATYLSDITITQGEFRLSIWKGRDVVIIGFVGNEGKGQQYRKVIQKGELDFVTE